MLTEAVFGSKQRPFLAASFGEKRTAEVMLVCSQPRVYGALDSDQTFEGLEFCGSLDIDGER